MDLETLVAEDGLFLAKDGVHKGWGEVFDLLLIVLGELSRVFLRAHWGGRSDATRLWAWDHLTESQFERIQAIRAPVFHRRSSSSSLWSRAKLVPSPTRPARRPISNSRRVPPKGVDRLLTCYLQLPTCSNSSSVSVVSLLSTPAPLPALTQQSLPSSGRSLRIFPSARLPPRLPNVPEGDHRLPPAGIHHPYRRARQRARPPQTRRTRSRPPYPRIGFARHSGMDRASTGSHVATSEYQGSPPGKADSGESGLWEI